MAGPVEEAERADGQPFTNPWREACHKPPVEGQDEEHARQDRDDACSGFKCEGGWPVAPRRSRDNRSGA